MAGSWVTGLIAVRDAVGPDLAELVAQYALVPTDTPDAVHWTRCAAESVYAEWSPLLELVRACAHGDLVGCDWITRRYVPRELKFDTAVAFWIAAGVGGYNAHTTDDIAEACRFRWMLGPPAAGPPADPGSGSPPIGTRALLAVKCGAFSAACRGGHLDLIQWMHREFGFAAADLRGGRRPALSDAVAGGRVELVEWLVSAFGFAADAAHDYFELTILHQPCMSGDTSMVQRLISMFEELSTPVRLVRCLLSAITPAVNSGHLHIAQLLVTKLDSAGALVPREWLAGVAGESPCPEAALYWLAGL